MDSRELDGCLVLASVYGTDASVTYVRGVARCQREYVLIEGEDGTVHRVRNHWANWSLRVDEQVLAGLPRAPIDLLAGVAYIVPVPPDDGDFAMARTPGRKGHSKKP